MVNYSLKTVFPITSSLLPQQLLEVPADELVDRLKKQPQLYQHRPWLAELAEIERIIFDLKHNPPDPEPQDPPVLTPGLELLETEWSGLVDLLYGTETAPIRQKSLVLIIPKAPGSSPDIVVPESSDVLAMKIIAENLSPLEISRQNGVQLNRVHAALRQAMTKGIIVGPLSKITRPKNFYRQTIDNPAYYTANSFTLQWHITQKCDLHCRHCYDRTTIEDVSLEEGQAVLDQLQSFCRSHKVSGQVSFTGGNPLLHPHFIKLYDEASRRGFMTAILGNPPDDKQLDEIVAIQLPELYQLSLEGLEDHNDYIRGRGHFQRTLSALERIRSRGIFTAVMLTLTRDNIDQVLPLAESLKGKIDLFSFNRLAMVGEGAALASAPITEYREFLQKYRDAAKNNPALNLKDNLFNLLQLDKAPPITGGCTGHGCGAAFNFVSLLPDGEVHACRKLPSKIGNIFTTSLEQIYHSPIARKYREGSKGCEGCEIRPICGGCAAVSHGFGRDIFSAIDPYCFIKSKQ